MQPSSAVMSHQYQETTLHHVSHLTNKSKQDLGFPFQKNLTQQNCEQKTLQHQHYIYYENNSQSLMHTHSTLCSRTMIIVHQRLVTSHDDHVITGDTGAC